MIKKRLQDERLSIDGGGSSINLIMAPVWSSGFYSGSDEGSLEHHYNKCKHLHEQVEVDSVMNQRQQLEKVSVKVEVWASHWLQRNSFRNLNVGVSILATMLGGVGQLYSFFGSHSLKIHCVYSPHRWDETDCSHKRFYRARSSRLILTGED